MCVDKSMRGLSLNPLKRVNSILTQLALERATEKIVEVSIPSNGSIQFLQGRAQLYEDGWYIRLNPLKRVNSILTLSEEIIIFQKSVMSQSPQTGQFNSYKNEQHNYIT